MAVEALDKQEVETFLLTRDPSRRRRRGDAGTCRLLLAHCRKTGRIPALAARPGRGSPIDRIVRTDDLFLANERGLGRGTISNHLRVARAFVPDCFGTDSIAFKRLSGREADRRSPSSCQLVVSALRGFLRHLHQRGELAADRADAGLAVPKWHLADLPKALAPGQVEALIEGCATVSRSGRSGAGIARASMSRVESRTSRPTSGMRA